MSAENPMAINKNTFSDYISENSLSLKLPRGIKQSDNTFQLVIMVSVSDNLGGINNSTITV